MIQEKSSEERLTAEEAEQKLQLAVLDSLIYSPLSVWEIKATVSEILSDALSVPEQTDFPEVSDQDREAILCKQLSKCEFVTTDAIQ